MKPFVDALERAEKLITEQRAEIERLQAEADHWRASYGNTVPKLEAESARLRADHERLWKWLDDLYPTVALSARRALERQSSRDPDEGLPTAKDVRGILKPPL